tara:strand:+ start:531 stop:905 length:375 start_codon:yes stop_codon:yes gene_type:complete
MNDKEKSVLKDWLLWIAETVNESIEIHEHFKQQKEKGKKGNVFDKIGQFMKLSNNAVQLPNLILNSQDIPKEWEKIAIIKDEILIEFSEKLNTIPEKAESILINVLQIMIHIGLIVEKVVDSKK